MTNTNNKIFVALSSFSQFGNEPIDILNQSKIEYSINPLGRRLIEEEIIEMGSNSTGIIAGVEPYSAQVLELLPRLNCISRAGVGMDNIHLGYAEEHGITIKNTPDVVIQPVVELTFAMIFDLLRRTTDHTIILKSKEWRKVPGNNLTGKTIGIIGAGRIGRAVAETLIKFNVKVVVHDIHPEEEWAQANGVQFVGLTELLKNVDIISIHVEPSVTDAFLLGKKEIQKMKKGVLIINTARGSFIDEIALCEGLNSGHVGGAGMDVFPAEPYKGNLIDCDNVLLTPHVATLTKESRLEMEIEATLNLLGYFNSSPERNTIRSN